MTFVKKLLKVLLPIALALISAFVLAKPATSPAHHAAAIQSLDDKRTTVMELTAASTAASAAITLIPGDVATPIAAKLADLSGYFVIVLCAIFLEKYLLTITGFAAFVILIPASCAVWLADVLLPAKALKQLAFKLFLFALAIYCVIPASVKVSALIEDTYSYSISAAIDSAKETTYEAEESSSASEDDSGGLFSSAVSKIRDSISGIADKVQSGVTGVTEKVQVVLNNFIEALAVMIVTSCLIPILVLLFFMWLIKVFLGVDISIPRIPKVSESEFYQKATKSESSSEE